MALGLSLWLIPITTQATHSEAHKIVCQSVNQVDPTCGQDENRLIGEEGVVTNVIQTMVFVVGAIAVLMIVIGAIMYAISSGNPDRAKTAWQTILYAIIGLAIAILAQGIVSFVLNKL